MTAEENAIEILKKHGWYDLNVSSGNYRIPMPYVLNFMQEFSSQQNKELLEKIESQRKNIEILREYNKKNIEKVSELEKEKEDAKNFKKIGKDKKKEKYRTYKTIIKTLQSDLTSCKQREESICLSFHKWVLLRDYSEGEKGWGCFNRGIPYNQTFTQVFKQFLTENRELLQSNSEKEEMKKKWDEFGDFPMSPKE